MPNRKPLSYAYPLRTLRDRPYEYFRTNEAAGRGILNLVTGKTIANAYSASGITYGVDGGFASDPSTAIGNDGTGGVSLPMLTAQVAEFSLACRIKLLSASSSGVAMHVGVQTTGYGFGIGGTTLDNTGTQLIGEGDNQNWLQSGTSLAVGPWYYIAMVVTGSNVLFYVNGPQVNSQASGSFNTPTTNNYMGFDGVGRHANFVMSDGAFYNYGLPSAQVAAQAVLAQ